MSLGSFLPFDFGSSLARFRKAFTGFTTSDRSKWRRAKSTHFARSSPHQARRSLILQRKIKQSVRIPNDVRELFVLIPAARLLGCRFLYAAPGAGHTEEREAQTATATPRWPSSHSTCGCIQRVYVSTPHYALSQRPSLSNDLASIVGGALERILQLLRDKIDHHIPSCTPPSCGQRNIRPTTRQQRHR